MNEDIQAANDALALMGVKLSPLAEMYADLHAAYTELLAEHAEWETIARRLVAYIKATQRDEPTDDSWPILARAFRDVAGQP